MSRVALAVFFFTVVFPTGYWLGRSGKPYNALILTVHKLVAVAASVLLVLGAIRSNRVAALDGPAVSVAAVTAGLALGLIATGGLLSSEKEMPAIVNRVHQIAPYPTVLCAAATLYLLLGSP